MSQSNGGQVIRRTEDVVAARAAFVFGIATIVWLSGPLSPFDSVTAKLAISLGQTATLWLAWKLGLRRGLVLDHRGITVNDRFTTDHIPWAALNAVDADRHVHLRLVGGQTLTPSLLAGTQLDSWGGYRFQHTTANAIRDAASRASHDGPAHRTTHRTLNVPSLVLVLVLAAALTLLSDLA